MSDFDDIFGGNFNAGDNAGQDDGEFAPLPAGDYHVIVEEAKLCTTKDGTGKYLKLKLRTDKNRIIWTNLNILNKKEKAQQIGRRKLGRLSLAIGKPTLRDSSELVGCSCVAAVIVRKRDDGAVDNDVNTFKAEEGATQWTPPAQATKPAEPPPPPPRRPWEKKAATPPPAKQPADDFQEAPIDNGLPF